MRDERMRDFHRRNEFAHILLYDAITSNNLNFIAYRTYTGRYYGRYRRNIADLQLLYRES